MTDRDLASAGHRFTAASIDAYHAACSDLASVRDSRAECEARHKGLTGDERAAADRDEDLWLRLFELALFRVARLSELLAATVRLWDDLLGDGPVKDPERGLYRNRGYAHRGKLYLSVVQEDDREAREGEDVPFLARDMELRVVDLRNVVEAPAGEGGAL